MSVDLKKRFDRIVEILIHLQSKRVVKAQELADRFEVSLRTIYRDIKSLEQAGVPIIGEAGTGYSIIDGYRLPPVIFTKEEALSFIAAEKLMEKFMDKKLMTDFKSAMYKVRSILRHSERDSLDTIEHQIIMRKTSYDTFNKSVPHALQTFFESIAHKRQVVLHYKGIQDEQPHYRTIEPIGLFHENNYWYIAAFCLKRNDYRLFRADRISDIKLININFTQKHISIDQFIENSQSKTSPIQIHLRVGLETAPYFNWQKSHYGFAFQEPYEDKMDLHFEFTGSLDHFARWFMMFADDAEILKPNVLKDKVAYIIKDSFRLLEQNYKSSFTIDKI